MLDLTYKKIVSHNKYVFPTVLQSRIDGYRSVDQKIGSGDRVEQVTVGRNTLFSP